MTDRHTESADTSPDALVALELVHALCSGNMRRANTMLTAEPDLVRSSFHAACACGETEFVWNHLARDASLATRLSAAGGLPMLDACFSRFLRTDTLRAAGIVEVVRLLLEHGADPNSHYYVEHDGERAIQTCLYGAAGIANNPELTRLLLEAGADVNELEPRGDAFSGSKEALYHASEFADVTCLELLLKAGPYPDWVSYCFGRNLDFDNEPGALLYLAHGADPNLRIPWNHNRSHLHKAAINGRSKRTIEAMLARGGDHAAQDAKGISAYRYALRYGHAVLVALFEAQGADPASATDDDRALGRIVRGEDCTASVVPDAEMLTSAARRNDVMALARLLDAGADVNAASDLPPLHAACFAGQYEAASLLIRRGASLTQKNAYGGTAIGTAMYGSTNCAHPEGGPGNLLPEEFKHGQYPKLVELLIAAGSPLPDQIWGGSEPVQEVLREHGVKNLEPA